MDLKLAQKISAESIAVNLLLSLFKLIAGVIGHSMAMIADAAHSASDVLSTVLVLFALRFSAKPMDSDHEYGHERFESIASMILSFMLAVVGAEIGWKGICSIVSGGTGSAELPGTLPLIAAVISVAVKEILFRRTKAAAEKCRSDALMADAWHHRSDALSSIGSFIGILGARAGFAAADAIAGVVISVFLIHAALEIFLSACGGLTDHACPAGKEEELRRTAEEVDGVRHVDMMKTRLSGAHCWVDVEIAADGGLTLRQAHEIAQNVHDRIENRFPDVRHCMVHVNPDGEE